MSPAPSPSAWAWGTIYDMWMLALGGGGQYKSCHMDAAWPPGKVLTKGPRVAFSHTEEGEAGKPTWEH